MHKIRKRIKNTKNGSLLPQVDYELSSVVLAGHTVFIQGQTGILLDKEGFVGKGDPEKQAENAMLCVRVLLEEVGSSVNDICKITTYVTNSSYRPLVYPVIARHLGDVYPCSTGIVVKGLAEPWIDFEIDVYAVISKQDFQFSSD